MVWQSLALFPFLNARENVEFGLKMRGVEPDEVTSWENRYRFRTGEVSISDYDYRETETDLLTTETTSKGHTETKDFSMYHFPIPYRAETDKHGTTTKLL